MTIRARARSAFPKSDLLINELGVDSVLHSFQDDAIKNFSRHRKQSNFSVAGTFTEIALLWKFNEMNLFPGR